MGYRPPVVLYGRAVRHRPALRSLDAERAGQRRKRQAPRRRFEIAMLSRNFCLVAGTILAGLSVTAGAFGAHGLDGYFQQKYAGRQYEKKTVCDGVESFVATGPLAQKYLADFKTGA